MHIVFRPANGDGEMFVVTGVAMQHSRGDSNFSRPINVVNTASRYLLKIALGAQRIRLGVRKETTISKTLKEISSFQTYLISQ